MRARLAALAALLLVAGCGVAPDTAQTPITVAAPAVAVTADAPTQITIAAIGVSSSLTQVGLDAHHELEVPPLSAPGQAAWYRLGPPPGQIGDAAQPGAAVIVGHINAHGVPGVFAHLAQLRPGDLVVIGRATGAPLTFRVSRVDQFAKATFPTALVYGPVDNPQLRVITCGGPLDTTAHSYLDNTVVSADLVT